MIFNNKDASVTEFYPTFLKEDRSYLRKITEMLNHAESHVFITCPWITLGEELVIPLENAISNNPELELYLITKLEKRDVFHRIQQLDDIEKWMDTLKGQMGVKYNNKIHSKMIIVDENEVIAGSSNLTGSGLGSSRDYEGTPQIESNIYTNEKKTVEEASQFFNKIWHHESSKDYDNEEYVLSCKSYHLSGIFQRYIKDFRKIANKEGWKIVSKEGVTPHNYKIELNGILSFLDVKKAYITGKKRKDVAVKVLNPNNEFNNFKLGDEVSITGKIRDSKDLSEFEVYLNSSVGKSGHKKNVKFITPEISNLTPGLYNIRINATIVNINDPIRMETKFGERFLTLLEIQNESGRTELEIWKQNAEQTLKEGEEIEIINAFTKDFRGNIRLALQRNNGEIKICRR